ncbi:MAG: InlB B-repeat-containing protein [Bacteroidales bacterium]|nr:InlB B-repeat-containing protein [Bacteroidales bacterium]
MLLFGGVTNLWGENIPSSLSFDWNSYGSGTSLSGTSSNNVILDGDFEWSGVGESNLKHSSGYCLFKGDDAIEVAQSRQKYTFQKGTYQVEIACMVKEDKKLYTPIVVVDQNTWNKSYATHPLTYTTSNPEKTWTETLEIVVPAAGDYYVRAQFKSTGDEKCGAGQITFTYKGGGDDPTPTCTKTLTWEAEDESKMISPTGVETCEYIKDKHCDGKDASSMVSSASDGHFISMKQNASADSKCIYYHFSTSKAADLAFTIRAGGFYNNKSATIILYSTKQSGSQTFTYEGKSYKKVSEQVKTVGASDQTWNDVECTFTNQPADDYVVAVHSSEHWWTVYFDKFTIEASDDVFCFETYALTLSNDGHGSAESNQTDDSAIPEGTKVTITATPNTGYAFDKWTGSSTETSNPFTFTMNAAKNYTATFKKSTKVCTNTLTWEAEDGKELNLKISGKVEPLTAYETETDAGATPATASPNYIAIGAGNSDSQRLCYAFEISEATTCSLTVRSKTSQTWNLTSKFDLWATNMSGDDHFEYNGDTYNKALKAQSFTVYPSWKEDTKSLETLVAGKYILAIGKEYQSTDYDYFTITASDDVFCTEAPATGYSITYHCDGGTTCPENEEDQTNLPDPLPTLSKAGFNFDGWFSDEQFEHPVTAGTELEDNIDLYAKWTEDLSTVWYMKGTFKDNWETQYDFVKATGHSTEQVASVTVQNLAANTNYWFQIWDNNTNHGAKDDNMIMYHDNTGWYLDGSKNVGVHTTAAGDYTFTVNFAGNDPTLTVHYPEFVTITVNLMGHGNNYELYTSPNGTISQPADPSADGFTFVGWFANDACTTPFDFAAPIAANTTIYAKWSQAYYYHEAWTSDWAANEMTPSDDGTYWYWYTYKSDQKRQFKIQKNGTWYGYTYNSPGFHCTDITDMNTDDTWGVGENSAVFYNGNDRYYIIVYVPNTGVNKTNNPIICASTFLPESSYSTAAGNKVYFDNSTTQWSNVYFRIGHKCWTNKIDMTKVPGTQNLYSCTTAEFTDYNAFHVADNTAWTDKNSIYAVRPGSHDINNCLSFIKENITTDITLVPTTTESSSPSYYGYNKSNGMLTHEVTLGEVANGTINVAYTDVAGSAQNMTSVSADLAHTCILTITFTPAQGYSATSFQVNGKDFTSGSPLILTEDITISATCAINQHNLTWADIEGATLTGDYTKAGLVNYGTTLVAPTVSKTGYEFTGWSPTVAATMPDNDVTYTAQWSINHYTLTWAGIDGATLKTAGTAAGDVDFGTSLKAPVYEKTGYTFAGWNPAVAATMPAAATTYTAQWTAKTYNLKLDKNGGSVAGSVQVTYNSNSTSNFSAPTRDNYIVEGFYAEQDCTTKVMNADGTLCTSVENYTDAYGNWVKDEACTLYTKWAEKPKVDALIVTPDNESYMSKQGGSATMSCSKEDDSYFTGHKVLKFTFSNMNNNWNGYEIGKDAAYNSSSSAGATGFGFWYKTEGDFTLAFCFDYNDNNGDQLKRTCQAPTTHGNICM